MLIRTSALLRLGLLAYKRNIMTTIVNFIEGNFIANPQEKEVEKPFWVLDSADREISHHLIVQCFLAKCKNDRKYPQLYVGHWFIWTLDFPHSIDSQGSQ